LISHCATAVDVFRSASIVGSATFTTDSSIYEIVDARMVTASTHGFALAVQSVPGRTARIAASSQGRALGLGIGHLTGLSGRARLDRTPRSSCPIERRDHLARLRDLSAFVGLATPASTPW
jgi:hypothetical protein